MVSGISKSIKFIELMLELKTRESLNTEWWDSMVDKCHNANLAIYSWYLDIVCKKKWWAIIDEERSIIMPLPLRQKWGILYAYQPKFVQQLGVFSEKDLLEEEINEVIEFIPKVVRWVHLNLNWGNVVKSDHKIIETLANIILPLNKPIDELQQNYRMNTKRNVRKANSHPLNLLTDAPIDQVITLFKQNRGKTLGIFSEEDYQMLHQLVLAAKQKNILHNWGVQVNGTLAAGAFFAGILMTDVPNTTSSSETLPPSNTS